ncbi:acyltransferase [Actinokineospora sp. NBRC 105648]|uniref:acyltransferase family protein n=1 Tax=Actinokineospora sp. NBRC 105648 TaxID=3032206 RepID=UPI00249F9916|nr:acyltransferase [Actinokineospora sp. NBRC 105648]GLZ41273.1 acyltransferase [Actinokineospora sp. NBRC 105648]
MDLANTRRYAPASHGFAWLRIVCALLVIFDHTAPISGQRPIMLPASWHLLPSHFGLMAFFAMSGYQVTSSWVHDPSALRFVVKRVTRIWPPLLATLLLTAVVIGPLFTTLSLGDYFNDQSTWGYVVNGASVLNLQHTLPGVFVDNPYPDSVNGSLWTLPMELFAYAIVLLLGVTTLLRRFPFAAVLVLVALVAVDTRLMTTGGGSFLSVPVGATVTFLVPFVCGVVLYLYRDRLPLSPAFAFALVLVQVAVHFTPVSAFWLSFAVSYGAITLVHHWPRWLVVDEKWVRNSYGTYLWGFPVTQMLAQLGLRAAWPLAGAAMVLSYGLGLLSRRYVELPTMRLRDVLLTDRRTVDTVVISRSVIESADRQGGAGPVEDRFEVRPEPLVVRGPGGGDQHGPPR